MAPSDVTGDVFEWGVPDHTAPPGSIRLCLLSCQANTPGRLAALSWMAARVAAPVLMAGAVRKIRHSEARAHRGDLVLAVDPRVGEGAILPLQRLLDLG
jgi:hypothetical protein